MDSRLHKTAGTKKEIRGMKTDETAESSCQKNLNRKKIKFSVLRKYWGAKRTAKKGKLSQCKGIVKQFFLSGQRGRKFVFSKIKIIVGIRLLYKALSEYNSYIKKSEFFN